MLKDEETQDTELEQQDGTEEETEESTEDSTESTDSQDDTSDDSEESQDDTDWKAEALKWKAIANRKQKPKPQKTEQSQEKKNIVEQNTNLDPLQVMDVVSKFKDYTPDELRIIARNAKGDGVSLEDAAKMEDTKLAINALRDKVAQEQETLNTNSRMKGSKGKSLADIPAEDLRNPQKYQEIQRKALERARGSKTGL